MDDDDLLMFESDVEAAENSTIELDNSPIISTKKVTSQEKSSKCRSDILLIYPPPPVKGGITVCADDYRCLEEGKFLNDVIIEFYIKYMMLNILSPSDRERTYIFSSHFYTRLVGNYDDSSLTDDDDDIAVKRHAGVQRWTKNVNIFEKDFIIVPINEDLHWFLAIICFPMLIGIVDNKAADIILSDEEEEIQKPCILIFDSLSTSRKLKVSKILKEYLYQEFLTKYGKKKSFSNEVLRTIYPRVPKQTNSVDCGLYTLQYVENFFKAPIRKYSYRMIDLSNWFTHKVIMSKRGEIANTIMNLSLDFNGENIVDFPKISFPSVNEIFPKKSKISLLNDEDFENEGTFALQETSSDDSNFHPNTKSTCESKMTKCKSKTSDAWIDVGELKCDISDTNLDQSFEPIRKSQKKLIDLPSFALHTPQRKFRRIISFSDKSPTAPIQDNKSSDEDDSDDIKIKCIHKRNLIDFSNEKIYSPSKKISIQSRAGNMVKIALSNELKSRLDIIKRKGQRTKTHSGLMSPKNQQITDSDIKAPKLVFEQTDQFYNLSIDALKNDTGVDPRMGLMKYIKFQKKQQISIPLN